MEAVHSRAITWLRFVLAAMIVYVHVPILSKTGNPLTFSSGVFYGIKGIISDCICRLAVPCFFVISGYFFFTKLSKWDTAIWLQKLKKRVWTLLIPFILWNLIALVQYWLRSRIVGEAFSFSTLYAERGIYINFPLWFMRDLMIMVVAAPAIFFLIKKLNYWYLILIAIATYFPEWPFPIAASSVLYFSLGSYMMIYGKDFITEFWRIRWPVWIAYVTVIAILFAVPLSSSWRHALLYIMTFTGVVSIFNAAYALMKSGLVKTHPVLSDSSFFIYAIHSLLLGSVAIVMNKVLPFAGDFWLFFKDLITAIITVVLIVLFYMVSSRILPKTTALLNGGRVSSK